MIHFRFSARKSLPQVLKRSNIFIKVDPLVCIYFALFLVLLPVKWIISWYIATAVHELFHYIALRIWDIPVRSISIRCFGIVIDADITGGWQEFICTLAGPFASFLLVLLMRSAPVLGFCALVQLCYNLLPMYPLDGGRALRCVLVRIFSQRTGYRVSMIIGWICAILIFCAGIYQRQGAL